jgi:hypothetical protein
MANIFRYSSQAKEEIGYIVVANIWLEQTEVV